MGNAKKRCVTCFMQYELARVKDDLAREKEDNQARTAAADKTIGCLQVYWVCMFVYTYNYVYCKAQLVYIV